MHVAVALRGRFSSTIDIGLHRWLQDDHEFNSLSVAGTTILPHSEQRCVFVFSLGSCTCSSVKQCPLGIPDHLLMLSRRAVKCRYADWHDCLYSNSSRCRRLGTYPGRGIHIDSIRARTFWYASSNSFRLEAMFFKRTNIPWIQAGGSQQHSSASLQRPVHSLDLCFSFWASRHEPIHTVH